MGLIETYPADAAVKQGWLEAFPIADSEAEIHIFVPATMDPDDYILTYPDGSGENVITTETYPDMSGKRDFLDYVFNQVGTVVYPGEYTKVGLPAFPKAEHIGKWGNKGKRDTWEDGRFYYQWDYQHGRVEKYRKSDGKHVGEFDAKTGTLTKPADPTRSFRKE